MAAAFRVASLCAGIGGLDLGIGLAVPGARSVVYVERDSYPATVLLERMETADLEPAPIWCGDLAAVDWYAWRGHVDCLAAGFPCQPHSTAGKRRGVEDERWIWRDIVDALDRAAIPFAFLENVPGLLSSSGGASFAGVLGDLAALGFDAEWIVLGARDVEASHRRERVFIFAARRDVADPVLEHDERRRGPRKFLRAGRTAQSEGVQRIGRGDAANDRVQDVVDPSRRGWLPRGPERTGLKRIAAPNGPSLDLGNADGARLEIGQSERGNAREKRSAIVRAGGENMADPRGGRQQGIGVGGVLDRFGAPFGDDAHRRGDEGPLFPPGPNDGDGWRRWLELRPGTEPAICRDPHGLPGGLDPDRPDQLKALGNAVVPLQAGVAFRVLAHRLGIAYLLGE